jgi:hypothetical protein
MGVALWPEQDEGLVPAAIFDADGLDGIQPHTAYQSDPIGWAVDQLGIDEATLRWSLFEAYGTHEWDGTVDPLVAVADAIVAWKDTGVESGTGTGKSFFAAVLILWFLACWDGARVFTFAPKEDQLRLYIWTEIGKLWLRFKAHFPTAELTDLCIRMRGGTDDSWGARGYAVGVRADEDVATKAAGMHAEHMLLVYEEMPGIDQAVIAAGQNTCTAPHNIRLGLGNPDHQLDTLHQFCMSASTVHIRVSALDHPNVVCGDASIVPGAVSLASIEKRRADYEEGSPLYESRVRGISAAQATDSLIRAEWIDQAEARYAELVRKGIALNGVRAKGVDVANSENGDQAAIADGVGAVLLSVRAFRCPDSNKLGTQVYGEMERDGVTQEHVGVDPVGVGAGTVNELARLKRVVRRLGGSNKPIHRAEKAPDGREYDWAPDANSFNNLRSQMHWQLREDYRLGRIAHPPMPALRRQLLAVKYEVQNGKTVVESKPKLMERMGGKSPNEGDSVVYWNWVRPRKAQPVPLDPDSVTNRAPRYDFGRKKMLNTRDQWNDEPGQRGRSLTRPVPLPRPRVPR